MAALPPTFSYYGGVLVKGFFNFQPEAYQEPPNKVGLNWAPGGIWTRSLQFNINALTHNATLTKVDLNLMIFLFFIFKCIKYIALWCNSSTRKWKMSIEDIKTDRKFDKFPSEKSWWYWSKLHVVQSLKQVILPLSNWKIKKTVTYTVTPMNWTISGTDYNYTDLFLFLIFCCSWDAVYCFSNW